MTRELCSIPFILGFILLMSSSTYHFHVGLKIEQGRDEQGLNRNPESAYFSCVSFHFIDFSIRLSILCCFSSIFIQQQVQCWKMEKTKWSPGFSQTFLEIKRRSPRNSFNFFKIEIVSNSFNNETTRHWYSIKLLKK